MFKYQARIKEPFPDFSKEKVKLKPIFKIKPEIYLVFLYLLLILGLLFFLLVFPGISHYGTYYNFQTWPEKAGVYIDGIYKGTTPCRVFVPAGLSKITFTKAFHKDITLDTMVEGRIFFTLLFPRAQSYLTSLELVDRKVFTDYVLKDFTTWSMNTAYHTYYHLPPILSDAVQSLSMWKEKWNQYNFLCNAALFTDTPEELQQLVLSTLLAQSGGLSLTPAKIQQILAYVGRFWQDNPNSVNWLFNALPKEGNFSQHSLVLKEWFNKKYQTYLDSIKQIRVEIAQRRAATQSQAGDLYINNIRFRFIPAGEFISGRIITAYDEKVPDSDKYFPYYARVNDFYLSETEITHKMFRDFIVKHPEWSKVQTDQLADVEKAAKEYLQDWDGNNFSEKVSNNPVVFVSYYAAKAFCAWIEENLPSSLKGFTVRLPYESEWDWASGLYLSVYQSDNRNNYIDQMRSSIFRGDEGVHSAYYPARNRYGLYNMTGNVWEWCESWEFPQKNLLASFFQQEPLGGFTGSEKIVKGGSWANPVEDLSYFTRGSQPPSWCSEYLGFRVVIEKNR